MSTRKTIFDLVEDMDQTDDELTDKLLRLHRFSKRFNIPNFCIGLLVGVIIGLITGL